MIIAYSFIGDTLNWTPCSCYGLFETQQQWPQQTKSLTSKELNSSRSQTDDNHQWDCGRCNCLRPWVTGLMVTWVMELHDHGLRLWVTALHGARGRDSPVPTIRDHWRWCLSWDLEDEKACQAEERASVKCGHTTGVGGHRGRGPATGRMSNP